MKIELMKIKNFRQFVGEIELSFSTDPTRNVTVVHGSNGSGKTSLLNAFKWCFYGETDFDTGNRSILNKSSIDQVDIGGSVSLEISVKFTHEKRRFHACRRQVFMKDESLDAVPHGDDVFTLDITSEDGQTERSKSPRSEMLALLPDNLQPYFFFNGERIEKLAGTNHSGQIQDAIKNLMGLELVERAISHLGKVKSLYRREMKKYANEEVGGLQDQCARLEDDASRYSEQVKAFIRLRETAEVELEDIDSRLKTFDKTRELQDERLTLGSQAQEKLDEIEHVLGKQKRLIGESGFLVLCNDLFTRCNAIVEKNRKKGVLPYRIKEQFIDDLIELGSCICGREITSNSVELDCLVKAREQAGSDMLEGNFTRLSGLLNVYEDSKARFYESYSEQASRLIDLQKDRDALSDRISEISALLRSIDDSEIASLERKRAEFSAERDRALQDEGIAKKDLSETQSQLNETRTLLDRLEGQLGKAGAIQRKIDAVEAVTAAFEELYQSLTDHVREDLSSRVNETFQSIIRKPARAIIDEDYKLKIVSKTASGHEYVVSEQSTGEKQVTSLSFIASIIALAREQHGRSNTFFQGGLFPLVMDSPFGALDDDYRQKVAGSVSELAEQVVMFVSNSQWSGKVKAACESRVGRSYRLIYYSPNTELADGVYVKASERGYEYTTLEEVSA